MIEKYQPKQILLSLGLSDHGTSTILKDKDFKYITSTKDKLDKDKVNVIMFRKNRAEGFDYPDSFETSVNMINSFDNLKGLYQPQMEKLKDSSDMDNKVITNENSNIGIALIYSKSAPKKEDDKKEKSELVKNDPPPSTTIISKDEKLSEIVNTTEDAKTKKTK